jgi:hypothetical protein
MASARCGGDAMTSGIPLTWLDMALDAAAVAVIGVEWYEPMPDDSDDAAGPAEDDQP